jgi:hypothetical protein
MTTHGMAHVSRACTKEETMMRQSQARLWGWVVLCVLCTLAVAQAEHKSKTSAPLRTQDTAAVQEIARLKQELARARRDLEALKNHPPVSSNDAPATDVFLAGTAYVNLKQ